MHTERFTDEPGQTLFAFPISGSLASWSTSRVACSESGSGRYIVTVDESIDKTWLIFIGTGAPASFDDAIISFEIEPVAAPIVPPAVTPVPGTLAETAAQPISVSADGTSVTMPSVMDRIEAQTVDAANAAGKKPKRGIRFSKLNPGSAVGNRQNF